MRVMTVLLLLPWLASSAVCLSIERLPLQQEEVQEDPAQLISIAEHLRKEHLGISNFNPSVGIFTIKISKILTVFVGFTFSCSTSVFTEDSTPASVGETQLRPDI